MLAVRGSSVTLGLGKLGWDGWQAYPMENDFVRHSEVNGLHKFRLNDFEVVTFDFSHFELFGNIFGDGFAEGDKRKMIDLVKILDVAVKWV